MTPPSALLVLLGFGAVCAVAGALWALRRRDLALRDALQERERLLALADTWLWQTDASHALRGWRPPARRPEGWAQAPALGGPLWGLLQDAPEDARPATDVPSATDAALAADASSPADALRRQMQAHAPLAEQRVVMAVGGAPRAWMLRGLPRMDAAGHFQGYQGSARPVEGEGLAGAGAGAGGGAGPGATLLPAAASAMAPSSPPGTAGAPPSPDSVAGESAADHESFIYSVSHDLRAPIRVVEGFARILKEDYGRALDRIGNDHTERILAAAARMNSMIDALLALSRLQSQPLKRQPVDMSQLATWIVEDLRRETPDRQTEVSIEPGLVIQGDPTLIRNAVENLIGNAWKYSGRNPQARIAMRRELRDGQAVYVVEDNGAGFDMRFADRLFGVFQRLHSAKDFTGTGVGLASVRRILRRHGGDIWAESEVGKGARFYFTVP